MDVPIEEECCKMVVMHLLAIRTRGERMYKLLLAVALLTVVCDSSVRRDLSTPSKRLIGHWQYEDSTQICFDSTDSHTKIGAYVFTDKDSTSLYLNYRIIAEVKAGERIEVMKNPHTLAERGTAVHTVFIVSKDGLEFTEIQLLRDVLGAEELAPGAESLVIRVGSDLVTQKRRLQNVEKELLECRRVLGRSYSIIGERCVGIDTT
ncbi:hypothetical protein IBX73_10900, partial [candidate division WOR-3 bacterium]|nr:hypothetical protein [candidate division WOR-3 bacterium]